MALSDPFGTTYEGARQGVGAFGQGILGVAEMIARMKEQERQRQAQEKMLGLEYGYRGAEAERGRGFEKEKLGLEYGLRGTEAEKERAFKERTIEMEKQQRTTELLATLATKGVFPQGAGQEFELEGLGKFQKPKQFNFVEVMDILNKNQSADNVLGITGATLDPITGEAKLNFGETPEARQKREIQTEQGKKEAETQRAGKESVGEFQGFIKQFERSYDELTKAYPTIGKTGIGGFGQRLAAGIGEKTGYFPETTAFLREIKPMANKMARTIEGGRVTDEDRKIYADSFANALSAPSQTNIRLASNALLNAYKKGGNISPIIEILKTSNNVIMQGIVDEVKKNTAQTQDIPSFSSEQKAEASGIKGVVIINGRKARID